MLEDCDAPPTNVVSTNLRDEGASDPQTSYRLVERIAKGGMANVYRAVQASAAGVEREIVIKRIKPHLADRPEYVRMFIEEAKLSALLSHPNLVQTYDLQLSPRGYFIAMEFVDGVSLLEVFRRGLAGQLPVPLVAAVLVQLLDALHYAHTAPIDGVPLGLVHRDVSPANVMISRQGVVKLLDFGIAKPLWSDGREDTDHGMLKGKLAYMSPEQIRGERLSARSDVFVSGTLLWEALTGRRLFKSQSEYETLRSVVRARVPAPSCWRADVPPPVDAICLKALAAEPDDRFESAEQMAEALETCVLAENPVYPSLLAAVVEKTRRTEPRALEPVKTRPLLPPIMVKGSRELPLAEIVGESMLMPA